MGLGYCSNRLLSIFVKHGCRIFVGKGTLLFAHRPLICGVPQQAVLDLPVLTGKELHYAAMAKKSTAGRVDGWAWNEVRALSPSWFVRLARQRPLCVLPVVYGLWPRFVWPIFRSGSALGSSIRYTVPVRGGSSVDAWYATTVDIEEVLSNTRQGDFHIFVADVVKSFDTVDLDVLDRALGRLGLPAWFRKVYFSFHREVWLRFAGLGLLGLGTGASPKDAPSAWSLLLRFTLLGAGIWKVSGVFPPAVCR